MSDDYELYPFVLDGPRKFYIALNKLPCDYSIYFRGDTEDTIDLLDKSPLFWLASFKKSEGEIFHAIEEDMSSYNRHKFKAALGWNLNKNIFSIVIGADFFIDDFGKQRFRGNKGDWRLIGMAGYQSWWSYDKTWFVNLIKGPGIETIKQGSTIADVSVTNTCIKCGYHNEFMDPVDNYICRQCKTREAMWT